MTRKLERGFTLFEVLIAFAILAVALAAISRATSMAIEATSALRDRQLALWVAQNRIAWHQAIRDWPALGATDGSEVQAGASFTWTEKISETPNRNIRRLEVSVRPEGAEGDYALIRVVSFIGEQ